jgi:hypothetical protein
MPCFVAITAAAAVAVVAASEIFGKIFLSIELVASYQSRRECGVERNK